MIYLSALLGGILLNFMPCVLPVLVLKIHRPSVAYFVGIFAVLFSLATAAVALHLTWGEQFSQTWFNVAITLVTFVCALNYLGVWEFSIPGFRMPQVAGVAGEFVLGALCTILSTPCSGAFLGPVFAYTLGRSAVEVYTIFALIGVGMSLPYFFLRFLPRPGNWTNELKRLSGFLLLATSLWLLYNVTGAYLWVTLILAWSLGMTLYYIGKFPLATALTSSVVHALLVPALFLFAGAAQLDWIPYSPEVFSEMQFEGKVIVIDFTGNFCLTCKANEQFVLNSEPVTRAVVANRVVTLKADMRDMRSRNFLQKLGFNSVPLLAVFPPTRDPILLPDLLNKADVVKAIEDASKK
jgi:thiol:disulfide interchange protein